MSFIEQWRCEESDDWWQFDQDCCRWNRDDFRCQNWWQDNPELLDDIKMAGIMDQEPMDQWNSLYEKGCDFFKESLKIPQLPAEIEMLFVKFYCGLETEEAQDSALNVFIAKKNTSVIFSPLDRAC